MTHLAAMQAAVVGAPPEPAGDITAPDVHYDILDLGEVDEETRRVLPLGGPLAGPWEDAPPVAGRNAVYTYRGDWYAASHTYGGGMGSRALATREEAVAEIAARVQGNIRFWMEKVRWARNGDLAPDTGWRHRGWHRPVIRCGGTHYIIGHEPSAAELETNRQYGGLGHGGSRFGFRMLTDGRIIHSHNVWYQGQIPAEFRDLLPDNAERYLTPEEEQAAAANARRQAEWEAKRKAREELRASLQPYSALGREHPMPDQVLMHVEYLGDYDDLVPHVEDDRDDDTENGEDEAAPRAADRTVTRDLDTASVVTSIYQGFAGTDAGDDWHRPVLDLDLPAKLLPSSTPDHFHLYIDKPMRWDVYVRLLEALADAGVVERGYVDASIERGHTAVRLPWVRKGDETDQA